MKANLYEDSWSDAAVRRFAIYGVDHLERLLVLSRSDITSHNENIIESRLKLLDNFINRINSLKSIVEIKSPLSGNEIMDIFKLPQCALVGALKTKLINAIIDGKLSENSSKEECIKFIENNQNNCLPSSITVIY